MGHANLSNLSELFINLLYAKGKVSIDDAVAVAVKRKETLRASEGEYDDDGMLAMGFNDVVAHLTEKTGSGYSFEGAWEGPWIEPQFERLAFSYNLQRIPETDTVKDLLLQCCQLWLGPGRRPFGQFTADDESLFGVTADAVQELGDEDWAWRIRTFPRQYRAWRMHELKKWEFFQEEENWKAWDSIKWVFREGWRRRYKNIPRLSNVTH